MLGDLMLHIADHGQLRTLNPLVCASRVCKHMSIITLLQGAGSVIYYSCSCVLQLHPASECTTGGLCM